MARKRRKPPEEAPVNFFSFQDIICCVTGILVLITMLLSLDLISRTESKAKQNPLGPARELIDKARAEQKSLREALSRVKVSLAMASSDAAVLPEDMPVLEDEARRAKLAAEEAVRTLKEKESLRDQLLIEMEGLKESSKTDAERLAELTKKVTTERERPDVPAPGGVPSTLSPIYVEFAPSDIRVGQLSATGQPMMIQRLTSYKAFYAWAQKRKAAEEYFILLVKPEGIADFAKLRFELRKMGFQVGWDAVLPDYSFLSSGLSDKKEAR